MESRTYDVVVVGGSGAGGTAAASAARAGARVAILSKEPMGVGNTRNAFGGFAGVSMSPGDSPEEFMRDMLDAGGGLGSAPLTRTFTREAREGLAIAESMGHIFRRDEEGETKGGAVGRAGGHRFNRGLSSPAQGVSVGAMLHNAVLGCGVDILEETLAFKILGRGRVDGVMALRMRDGKVLALSAPSVILASGGAGWIYYPHTDCVRSTTGDGFALALEAGAELMGMEFMQFLPFAITHPASFVGVFLGEPSSTGPGGRLVNGKGEVVMTNMRSKTRSQVAAAIALEMAAGNTTEHGGILLDPTPNLETPEGRKAWQSVKEVGLLEQARLIYGERAGRFEEPWDVAPTAHFNTGGVRIDGSCRSTVEGLYAAGEVAGGVHGADRLGGTALTEIFLFGRKAGEAAAAYALTKGPPKADPVEAEVQARRVEGMFGAQGGRRPISVVRRLQKLMWDRVGIVRTEDGLQQGLTELDAIERDSTDLRIRAGAAYNTDVADALELEMMLETARAMAVPALERRESRGGHVRLDYPGIDDANWLKNLVVWKEGDKLKLKSQVVAPREEQR